MKGQAAEWLVTNRAEHDFASLTPEVQERSIEVLDRLLAEADWRHVGAAPVPPHVTRHFHVKNAWCFRVGKHRIIVAREGLLKRVLALPSRGDKTIFNSEH